VAGLQTVCSLRVFKNQEAKDMGARQKLNSASFICALLVAGLLGLVADSVAVFLLAVAVLLVAGWVAGDIRV
jgi:hypothetical protein